jgi:hypothetical protein
MSIRLMSAVWDMDLPAGEKIVLLALADQANDEGRQCWPSVETIMRRSGQGERTVRRALSSLEEKGHLTRNHRVNDSTQYHIHPCQNGTPAELAPVPNTTVGGAKSAPKPSRTTISSQKATPSSRAGAKPKLGFHRLPDDWEPAPLPEITQAKLAQWPPGKISDELAAFRGWAANAKNEDGKGRKLNWNMAWVNWLNRAHSDWIARNGIRNIASQTGSRTLDAMHAFVARG